MYQRNSVWRVQWTEGAKRRSKTFASMREAKKFQMELELGIAEDTSRHTRLTFAQFGEKWLRDHVKTEKAESQWKKDEARLKLHLIPSLGRFPLMALRQSHLLELKSELLRKKAHGKKHLLGRKSANLIIAQAKAMMTMAVAWEMVPTNPFTAVKLYKTTEQPFSFWATEERDRFEGEAPKLDLQFARLVTTAAHTGLRRGELAGLMAKDLDFKRGQILVERSWSFEAQALKPTKGGEVSSVPMNERAREALLPARFLQPNDFVFGRGLFIEARARLAKLAFEVEVTPIRFHDLRHTFASLLAIAGTDLMVIQKLLRHKSYQMTLRYARFHPDHLKGATDVLCTIAAPDTLEILKNCRPRGT